MGLGRLPLEYGIMYGSTTFGIHCNRSKGRHTATRDVDAGVDLKILQWESAAGNAAVYRPSDMVR